MLFSKFIENSHLRDILIFEGSDFEINSLKLDSRKVADNDVFFAVKGYETNGELYIKDALENGAKAIFVSNDYKIPDTIKGQSYFVICENVKQVMANLIESFYKLIPSNISAVTGTNGKTSVVNFARQIMNNLSLDSASIGTIGVDYNLNGETLHLDNNNLTSADIISNYSLLQNLKKKYDIDNVFFEASSHGLDQGRFGNLIFKSAAFTNLSQDHLDYHKNMDDYFQAKMKLFSRYCDKQSHAVINGDIEQYQDIRSICDNKSLNILDYGKSAEFLKINNLDVEYSGISADCQILGEEVNFKLNLYGEFNIYNFCCAMLLVASNIGRQDDLSFYKEVAGFSSKIISAKGRMQIIDLKPKKNSIAIIDYAHTPDALEKAINSAKNHSQNKIITVFGCGGDRDKSKRKIMGEIADKESDIVIVTDDNPRTEDAANIRAEILSACKKAQEIADRKQAIIYALESAQQGDIVLIAGKGHENYQIIGKEKIYFDDSQIVKDFLTF
jgi:UDP-N-acetylmuramoyl-L-alanyl-D-glutamate--2,6-diaminopimelate ligase